MAEAKATAPSWTRSIDVETETAVEGIVTGNIPEWMEGTLIRNGSGLFEIGTTKMEHLFDGLSVLHRFAIKKGKATYQNRLLKSQAYLEAKEANRLTIHQYGTFAYPDPCKSVLGKFMSRFEKSGDVMTDNCSVNVCYIGDKLYAMTETFLMRQIDPESLETIGDQLNVSKYVAVNHSTAHPHVDKDGTVYNMGTTYGGKGQGYNIIQFPPGEGSFTGAKIAATFPARWKLSTGYYHSFGITDNYFIFIELPIVLNSMKLLTINLRQQAFSSAMEWYPKERARIMLADRKTGQILPQIFEAPSFFVFHHGNAYEKDGNLVMDLSHFNDASILTDLSLKNLCEKSKISNPYYSRFILPLNAKLPEDKGTYSNNLIEVDGFKGKAYWLDNKTIMCEPDRLCELSMELPRINYELNGKPYRYVYAVSNLDDSVEFTKVVKLDVETRETKEWTKEGLSTSEPVFVARPGSTEEDEGCIIFSAVDLNDPKRVFLVILDAATFHEEAMVEFTANGVVTKDFHGIFSRDGDSTHLY